MVIFAKRARVEMDRWNSLNALPRYLHITNAKISGQIDDIF